MISFSARPRLWRELLLACCWPVVAGDRDGNGQDTAKDWAELSSRGLFVSDPIYRYAYNRPQEEKEKEEEIR